MLQDFFLSTCGSLLLCYLKKLMKKSKIDFCFFSTPMKDSLYSSTKIKGFCVCYRMCSLLSYDIVEG